MGKRLLLGRKLRSTQVTQTLLPKRIALPVFASDALSSVAYAPDEIFITLALAGAIGYSVSWQVGLAVAVVLVVVVLSYRQNVRAYQSGGGDYEVATVNLGRNAGLVVGSALSVDYVLTVAVSISSAAQYAATAIEPLQNHKALVAVLAVLALTAMNLRGVRESGRVFATPAYLFMFAILGMAVYGFWQYLVGGGLPAAESAGLELPERDQLNEGLAGLAGVFLLLRAFSSGCAALTGVEAIANGVPAFRKPKGRNAARTLLLLGALASTMLMSVIVLANITDVRMAENSADLLRPDGSPVPASYHQDPVIGQLAGSVFADFSFGFYVVSFASGVILVMASNTAFNGFPVLGSILARDGYLPKQLHTRGDRLAYSNGIILLAVFAIALILIYDAQVTSLIQLYIVGVFVSFTVGQLGMVRHWTRHLRDESDRARRLQMQRSRLINGLGFTVTAVVLVVVVVTKFVHGAYIAVFAMVAWFALMKAISRHYESVAEELRASTEDQKLPARVHAAVLVSKLHKPTMRALAYARASHPSVLEAISVDVIPEATAELMDEWDRRGIPVPLRILSSPYREVTRPIVEYVRSIRRASPSDVVTVFIPEYVVGHWWEQLLHNQSALRLKTRLLFTPGVMVTSVPYQLKSSQAAAKRAARFAETQRVNARRRGLTDRQTMVRPRERRRRP